MIFESGSWRVYNPTSVVEAYIRTETATAKFAENLRNFRYWRYGVLDPDWIGRILYYAKLDKPSHWSMLLTQAGVHRRLASVVKMYQSIGESVLRENHPDFCDQITRILYDKMGICAGGVLPPVILLRGRNPFTANRRTLLTDGAHRILAYAYYAMLLKPGSDYRVTAWLGSMWPTSLFL